MKQKKIVLMLIIALSILSITAICFASSVIKDTYKVEENIISRILPDTSLEEFANHIIDNASIAIENETIGTGVLATINENIYSLVVCGDTNGDGKITATDLSRIKNHILEKSTLADLAFKAVDINEDGRITASELTKIKNYVLGLDVKFYERDLSNFSWDETTDAGKNITTKSELNFKVIALDKDGNTINDVTWEVSAGTLDVSEGLEVNWVLPNEENTYKITAILSDERVLEKEIKYIQVISSEDEELETIEMTYELDGDEDGDGLTNEQEYDLGTNILYDDTDGDGINDYEEINVYNTNPLKEDTDGDGILDLNEILLGLNPCDIDSDGDGILDGEENITYNASNEELGVNIEINGQGNVSDVIIDTVEINELDNINAITSPIYNFSTNGNLEKANVEITYDETTITDKGFNEEDLSLYYFNPSDYTFEKVETTIDTENNTASATLSHFSMYLLANKNTMIESLNNQIMFVIDNSGSMYSIEDAKNKYEGLDDEDVQDWPENDPEYKRLEIVSNLIDKLDSNFEFGVAKFTKHYTVLSEMGQNKEQAKNGLEKIRTEGEKFNGTYIAWSLLQAVENFESDSTFNRYIVLITDGEDTDTWSSEFRTERAIETAKEKNIKVITVGLGNEIDEQYLKKVANSTGGKYFYASDANILNELYESLYSELNLKRVEIENEEKEKEEYLVIADSGFNPAINGLPFRNYRTTTSMGGNCYGIAMLSKLYYTNELNLSESIERKWHSVLTPFNYDLSNLDSFKNNKVLGSYEFSSEAFEKLMTVTNEELYDYEKLDEDFNQGNEELYLEFKKEYKDYVKELGGVVKVKTDDKKKKVEGYGEVSCDILYIDIDSDTEDVLQKCPDLQLFKAIDYYYVDQFDEEGVDGDISKRIDINSEKRLQDLINEINNGKPVIISYEVPNNAWIIEKIRLYLNKTNHAVNGIQVLRSTENPNNYKIAIYNNNSPGETEYLDLIKRKSIINGEISYKMYIDLESKQKTNIFFQY